jgi:hypothetical protein
MTRSALKPAIQQLAPVVIDSGSLEHALHPMHQGLLERWTAAPEPLEAKFSPRVRLAIVVFAAALSWAIVIGIGWGIASLV